MAFDPTNQLVGAIGDIRVALGRDYADAVPTSRCVQRRCEKHSLGGGDGCAGEFVGAGGITTGHRDPLQVAN
jgi:hypothetical protein